MVHEPDWNDLWERCARWFGRILKGSGALGTLLALIYFLRIKSMPIDSLQSVAGLAAAIALVSLALFAAISIYWGLPGLVLRFCVESADTVVTAWFLDVRSQGSTAKASRRPVSLARTLCWCSATVGTPWLLLLSYTESDLFGGKALVGWTQGPVFILATVVIIMYTMQSGPRTGGAESRRLRSGKFITTWQARTLRSAMCFSVVLTTVFPLLIFLYLFDDSDLAQEKGRWHVLAPFLAATVFVVVVCAFSIRLVVQQRASDGLQRWIAHPLLIAASVVIGITCLEAWGSLLDRVMALVSVRIPDAVLVLNRNGCQPFETTGLKVLSPISAPSAAREGCVVKNVTVLSRVGARWPIVCRDNAASSPHASIKADDVTAVLTNVQSPLTLVDASSDVQLCVKPLKVH